MEQNQINLIELERMFDELAQKNWAVSSTIFEKEFCQKLAQECQDLFKKGAMKQASIGHLDTKTVASQIRGDHTLWLDEATASNAQLDFLASLEILLQKLNESFYLGLKRFETHFAFYPSGTGYDKHVDNHRGTGARRVTFILYLNENWQRGHGGELSLFSPNDPDKLLTQIEPHLGTFALFRSDLFPHQVEKSFQPRLSLTGWLRNDAL